MAKLFRGNERGAVSGYAVGVVVLAIVLIGGVLLLKNISNNKSNINKPLTVDSGEFKADGNGDKEKEENENEKPETASTVGTTGPTTEHNPDELIATGPESFVTVIIGLILAGATIYVGREYVKSRSAIKLTLLQK
ncbi:hypothetical protein FWC31_01885 [Candidatus Saccharibacteria bacterium]|nr:hypothetical protein [Candidatus Saccharibacteria bacterium]